MTHLKGDHWKVYCEVPAGKLEKFMQSTVGPYHIELGDFVTTKKSNVAPPSNGKGPARIGPNTVLMRTDQDDAPKKGDNQAGLALHEFEKLEAKHGIGEVTRAQLTEVLSKKRTIGSPTSTISLCLSDGWLTRIA